MVRGEHSGSQPLCAQCRRLDADFETLVVTVEAHDHVARIVEAPR